MSHFSTIFQQLHHFLPGYEFEKAVSKHSGDYYVKKFNCKNQLTVMLYAQACGKDSLRDIETGLNIHRNLFYHLNLNSVARSTIAYANSKRNYRIFEDLFYRLLEKCRDITPARKFRFKNPLFTLDSTVIDLCLETFPWASFRQTKGAIKIHTLLNNRSQIPEFLVVTDARQHDLKAARSIDLPLSSDSILVMDKAYLDLEWLHSLACRGVFFVTRAKDNMNYEVIGQQMSPGNSSYLKDQTIKLGNYYSKKKFPENLRRIEWVDKETGQILVFLTNNFDFAASTIAGIYKARWQVEIFFKWIKQNLKIKTFLGTSENAVKTQIWIAMIYYLLLCYIKYQTKYSFSLLEFTRIISEALFLRRDLIDLLSLDYKHFQKIRDPDPQLSFF